MKLNEAIVLLENPRDHHALEGAARVLADYIMTNLQHHTKDPFVFKMSDVRGLSHLYPRLRSIEVVVFYFREEESKYASFSPRFKEIVLFGVSSWTREQLESTLIHELRHALDNSLSKGNFIDRRNDYLHSQHEINARFTQAIQAVNSELRMRGGMTPHEYLDAFEKEAVKRNLINIFADPSQGEAQEWLSKMDSTGNTPVFGMKTDTRLLIQHYTNSSMYSSAITDKKRWQRLLTRVYKAYEYEMEKLK